METLRRRTKSCAWGWRRVRPRGGARRAGRRRARGTRRCIGHGRHGSMRSASFARRTVVEASALERMCSKLRSPKSRFRVEISCAVIGWMRALCRRKDSRTEVYKKCLLNPLRCCFLFFRLASCTLSKSVAEPRCSHGACRASRRAWTPTTPSVSSRVERWRDLHAPERWRETVSAEAVAHPGARAGASSTGFSPARAATKGSTRTKRRARRGWVRNRGFPCGQKRQKRVGVRASRRDPVALTRGAGPTEPHALRQPRGRAVFVQQAARVRADMRRDRPAARPRAGALLRGRRGRAPRRVRGGGHACGGGNEPNEPKGKHPPLSCWRGRPRAHREAAAQRRFRGCFPCHYDTPGGCADWATCILYLNPVGGGRRRRARLDTVPVAAVRVRPKHDRPAAIGPRVTGGPGAPSGSASPCGWTGRRAR